MAKEFIFPVHVYTEDTDYGGVVYYVNYLKFMERARTSWLNQIGLPLMQFAKQNILFVVRNASAEYLAPARLNDDLEVISRVEKLGGTSMTFAQDIRIAGQEKIICRGQTVVVCTNELLKPRRLPEEMMEKLSDDN